MSTRLPRSTPTEQKISESAIHSFLNEVEEKGLELHSFMLLRNGAVAAEGWWAPYAPEHPHMLFSLSKSFASTGIGLAEAEGLLSVEDRVVTFFPELVPSDASEYLREMKIHDLLSMATGHNSESLDWIREHDEPEHWVKGFLRMPIEYRPGTHFQYNTGATYMLSAIVQKVTGVTLLEYLQPRLFEPLGIEGARWGTCPRGISLGGFGLSLNTEAIAKFGQLYLQKGLWNGTRLLPEAWVEKATSAHISNGDDPNSDWAQGYGYQFWRCRHGAYRGDGMFGQNCIVLPEQNAVIAITSAIEDLQALLNAVWAHLLPAFRTESTVSDSDEAGLKERLQQLSLPQPRMQSSSALEQSISGKRYVMEDNDSGLKAVRLDFKDDEAVLTLWSDNWEHVSRCGRHNWLYFGTDRMDNHNQRAAASFTWRDEETLVVTQCLVESPFKETVEFRFADDKLQLDTTLNVGEPKHRSLAGTAE